MSYDMLVTNIGNTLITNAKNAGTQLPNLTIRRANGIVSFTASSTSIAGAVFYANPDIGNSIKSRDVAIGILVDPKEAFYPCTLALMSGNNLIAAIAINIAQGVAVPSYLTLRLVNKPIEAFTARNTAKSNSASASLIEASMNALQVSREFYQPVLAAGQLLKGTGLNTPPAPGQALIRVEVTTTGTAQTEDAKAQPYAKKVWDTFNGVVWVKDSSGNWNTVVEDGMPGIAEGEFGYSQYTGILYYRFPGGSLYNLTT